MQQRLTLMAGIITVASVVFLPAAKPAIGADPAIEHMQAIAGTEVHRVESRINGHRYNVLVALPDNHAADPEARYPAVYLLDGGATYPMLAAYYRYLRFEEAVPDLVIVGISYGSDKFEQGNYRSNDYTAPSSERDHWGGAARFLDVLEREVLPVVEQNSPADPTRRILFGQSLGGQFVLYAALNRPDMFHGYIASNPALHRNLETFLHVPEARSRSGSRLFVASGSMDAPEFREPALRWMDNWRSVSNRPWLMKAISIEGYGHFSLAPEAFRQGLVWIFDSETAP